MRSTHCTVRHYGFFDESCCRSLVVLLYLLSQYLNLSEIERLTTSHLIGCENLCTHYHWGIKFVYGFSLTEQVYVRILIDGANLCTHSHWLIKFVYPFSLAEKSCLHILIGGANLCTHSLWLSKFMYTWGAKKHSKQLLTDTILLGNRYKVMSICFHVVCKSKLSCYLQVAESLNTPVILL